MKALAALSLLLLAACASSDGFEGGGLSECGGESLIDVRVGIAAPPVQWERTDDRLMMYVEVSNNSSNDIVVKSVRIEQTHAETSAYNLDEGYASFNETIAEADDHTFEVPMTGRGMRGINDRRETGSGLNVTASVMLEDGRTLRCRFDVQAPR